MRIFEDIFIVIAESGINYQYGQIMVAAWRIYGTISRTSFLRASKVLFHIKF
jgi:hypothetical protein